MISAVIVFCSMGIVWFMIKTRGRKRNFAKQMQRSIKAKNLKNFLRDKAIGKVTIRYSRDKTLYYLADYACPRCAWLSVKTFKDKPKDLTVFHNAMGV